MANRLDQVREWLRELGSSGATANARGELERRAAEHLMLATLEGRAPAVRASDVAAA